MAAYQAGRASSHRPWRGQEEESNFPFSMEGQPGTSGTQGGLTGVEPKQSTGPMLKGQCPVATVSRLLIILSLNLCFVAKSEKTMEYGLETWGPSSYLVLPLTASQGRVLSCPLLHPVTAATLYTWQAWAQVHGPHWMSRGTGLWHLSSLCPREHGIK